MNLLKVSDDDDSTAITINDLQFEEKILQQTSTTTITTIATAKIQQSPSQQQSSQAWFRTQRMQNELLKERQKIFPTETRAIIIPTDSSFYRLCLDLEPRFKLNSNNLNLRLEF
ncbi:hypothetical protein Glove_198g93 [Diversispora epigaea]|uniref:Uncharacterized protein n=1 Tax=Diversispora epigaea TaxID=1348612 RepID=A0A397IRJ3_9GLOM|nr:hypothetical protein Glove_198g93 [Diversispora epigaea]